jgi:hypothetical protein
LRRGKHDVGLCSYKKIGKREARLWGARGGSQAARNGFVKLSPGRVADDGPSDVGPNVPSHAYVSKFWGGLDLREMAAVSGPVPSQQQTPAA